MPGTSAPSGFPRRAPTPLAPRATALSIQRSPLRSHPVPEDQRPRWQRTLGAYPTHKRVEARPLESCRPRGQAYRSDPRHSQLRAIPLRAWSDRPRTPRAPFSRHPSGVLRGCLTVPSGTAYRSALLFLRCSERARSWVKCRFALERQGTRRLTRPMAYAGVPTPVPAPRRLWPRERLAPARPYPRRQHDLVVVLDLQLSMQPGPGRGRPVELLPLRVAAESPAVFTRQYVVRFWVTRSKSG
jgi:hypothetical protein